MHAATLPFALAGQPAGTGEGGRWHRERASQASIIASEHHEQALQPSPLTDFFLLLAFTHGAEHPGMVVRMLGSAKGCQSQPCGTTACREEGRGLWLGNQPHAVFLPM